MTRIPLKAGLIREIPEDWDVVKIREIAKKIKAGGTPKTTVKEYYENGDIPFVKIEDITTSGKYLENAKVKITKKGLENSTAWLVPSESILFAMYGSIGAVTINKIPVATNQAILGIIINDKKADVEFVYYLLRFLGPLFEKHSKQTTQANLTAKIVKEFKIPLPPLPEQRKIAEILRTVDEAIEKTDLAIERTERLKKGLMQRLLTRGIRHERFKKTELGEIPEEWRVVKFKEVVISYKNGIYKPRLYYGKGYPCIRMYNLVSGRVTKEGAPLLDVTPKELEEYGLLPGDIVINRVNTPDLVGKVGVVPQNFGNATFESKNIRVRVNTQKLLPEFFAIYSQTPKYMAQVKALAKIAVAQATITQKDLDNIKLPLPPLSEQKQIAEILLTVDKKLELLRKRREKLERIKRGLMKDLLTGRRRVSV